MKQKYRFDNILKKSKSIKNFHEQERIFGESLLKIRFETKIFQALQLLQ
jgi:hypothetical protein